jgi:hypothetical protein
LRRFLFADTCLKEEKTLKQKNLKDIYNKN